jgi:hypothetical protein
MAEKYTDRIKEYCESSGVEIPAGFYRHSASRYVVIDLEATPPKLVAKTWFNQEDVLYYLQNLAAGKSVKILDFKDRQELSLENSKTLKHGAPF